MVELPAGAVLQRVTDEFDNASVPRGLLRAHRVAATAWAKLIVREGTLTFVFEDDGSTSELSLGAEQVIPPSRPHRLQLDGPVRFVIEFYRTSD